MFKILFGTITFSAMLRMSAPLILSAVGGSFNNRAGTLNIAHEAIMLIGAFFAVYGSYLTSNPWIGLLVAIGVCLIVSVIYGVFVFHIGSNPMVVSIALNTGAGGFTALVLYSLFRIRGSLVDSRIKSFSVIDIPFIKNIPWLGKIVSGQIALVYIAFLFAAIAWIVMYRTTFGLHIRAVGMNPKAAQTAGISILKYKWIANIICGIADGAAGAFLPLCGISMFTEDMSSGRGFLAVAAILIGQGNPIKVMLSCLLFGYAEALTVSLQNINIPSQIVLMLPYVATVFVLLVSGIRNLKTQKDVL